MTKQEYIKEYIQRVEKKLNETKDAYALYEYTECEFCPFDEDGCGCVSCIDALDRNIENISEV